MFSIPVTGLAKAATAVTISLHPAAAHQAHQAPAHYTVKSGDTFRVAYEERRDANGGGVPQLFPVRPGERPRRRSHGTPARPPSASAPWHGRFWVVAPPATARARREVPPRSTPRFSTLVAALRLRDGAMRGVKLESPP